METLKKLEGKKVATLNGSKYVLIEFSLTRETEDIGDAINDLTAKGYVPIIAHPERYPYLQSLNDYQIMRRMGAKIQVNSGSLTGYYGKKIKKFVWKILKNDLVDFVASDIHDFRMSTLKVSYDMVAKLFGLERANKIYNNKEIFE